MNKIPTTQLFLLITIALAACGGRQQQQEAIETRPLEESSALEIIEESLGQRGYQSFRDVAVELGNKARFKADFRVAKHGIAVEYLTEQDRIEIGQIPPAAPGSRLHVLAARTVSEDPAAEGEPIYVFLIHDTSFVYHYNPTSEQRADVTFLEVDSRLRRDMADFLSWYEASQEAR